MLSNPGDVVVKRYQSMSSLEANCPVIDVLSVSAFAVEELLLGSCSTDIFRNPQIANQITCLFANMVNLVHKTRISYDLVIIYLLLPFAIVFAFLGSWQA